MAKILNKQFSTQLHSKREALYMSGSGKKRVLNPLYLFIVLTTEEFKDQIAHLGRPDFPSFSEAIDVIGKLNQTDLKQLKDEIIDKNSSLPVRLKEFVQATDV